MGNVRKLTEKIKKDRVRKFYRVSLLCLAQLSAHGINGLILQWQKLTIHFQAMWSAILAFFPVVGFPSQSLLVKICPDFEGPWLQKNINPMLILSTSFANYFSSRVYHLCLQCTFQNPNITTKL